MTDFAFDVLTEEELEEETKDPYTTTYDTPIDRTGMIYCEFCKGYYFPEYHYGDVSNDLDN